MTNIQEEKSVNTVITTWNTLINSSGGIVIPADNIDKILIV
jgi:hypothetical protein